MDWARGTQAYAVLEDSGGEPLILSVHVRPDCQRVKEEANDPEVDRLRDMVRHPDRIMDILNGSFAPTRGIKRLVQLKATGSENEFCDDDGTFHIIASCQLCTTQSQT